MKNCYNNLQEEMRDLLELENEIKDESVLELLKAKKQVFFNKTLAELEGYKKEYAEKEGRLESELIKLNKAVHDLNKYYKDRDFYEKYSFNASIKIHDRIEELKMLQSNKQALQTLDSVSKLVNEVKIGKISTIEFSDKLKQYKQELNDIENAINYKSQLTKKLLEIQNKNQKNDKNRVNSEQKRTSEKHMIAVDSNENYKK